MWTLIWLVAAAATITFGFFIMKRVDRLLEGTQPARGSKSLCIGISDPMTIGGVAKMLERFQRRYPEVPVRLFQGKDEALIEGLIQDNLDIIFVSESAKKPSGEDYVPQTVSLEVRPIDTTYGGPPIEPFSGGALQLTALWRRMEPVPATRYFVECLQAVSKDRWKKQKRVL